MATKAAIVEPAGPPPLTIRSKSSLAEIVMGRYRGIASRVWFVQPESQRADNLRMVAIVSPDERIAGNIFHSEAAPSLVRAGDRAALAAITLFCYNEL